MSSRSKLFRSVGRKHIQCSFPNCSRTFYSQYGLTQHIRRTRKHQKALEQTALPARCPSERPVSSNESHMSPQADPEPSDFNFRVYDESDADFLFDDHDSVLPPANEALNSGK